MMPLRMPKSLATPMQGAMRVAKMRPQPKPTAPPPLRPHFDVGGMPAAPPMAPSHADLLGSQVPKDDHVGPVQAPVAGRTDAINLTVPEGSYVVPADVVNHHGQDNSAAGMKVLDGMFHGTKILALRRLGNVQGQRVPIAVAGGEYVVPPETVVRLGHGNMDEGHKILDSFVKQSREAHIRALQKMKGPQGS